MVSTTTSTKSAAISPSRSEMRLIGSEQQAVEVAVLDVHHERAGPRHPGDRGDDGQRKLEGLVVEAGRRRRLDELLQRADVHHEEEERDDEGRKHRLGLPHRQAQGPQRDGAEVGEEAHLAGPGSCGRVRWARAAVIGRSSPCRAAAGELEEHVVERGGAQAQVGHRAPRTRRSPPPPGSQPLPRRSPR